MMPLKTYYKQCCSVDKYEVMTPGSWTNSFLSLLQSEPSVQIPVAMSYGGVAQVQGQQNSLFGPKKNNVFDILTSSSSAYPLTQAQTNTQLNLS